MFQFTNVDRSVSTLSYQEKVEMNIFLKAEMVTASSKINCI